MLVSQADSIGTIPAPAGKPALRPRSGSGAEDYPRARGETTTPTIGLPAREGLSPRPRGNLHDALGGLFGGGTIPAPAGKPSTCGSRATLLRDYPRARGETRDLERQQAKRQGLSPRPRGNHARIALRGSH